MKFEAGSDLDSDHQVALTHEFYRCEDAFQLFHFYGEMMVIKGKSNEVSYLAYNAYADFIHHLYEFLMGCFARDTGNTNITNKKVNEKLLVIEHYITRHAQRVMGQYKDAIKDGRAPDWVNDISYYDVPVPSEFAKDFRQYRNKISGHVAYERSSQLNLSEFYQKYHKFLYYMYRDSIHYYGRKNGDFPNLKDITDFSVMITK